MCGGEGGEEVCAGGGVVRKCVGGEEVCVCGDVVRKCVGG